MGGAQRARGQSCSTRVVDWLATQVDNQDMEHDVHEVIAQWSKLIAKVRTGEHIVITGAGVPIARLVPIRSRRRRSPGTERGTMWVAADFDAPLADEVFGGQGARRSRLPSSKTFRRGSTTNHCRPRK
jgi:prevent-host-death family protein